MNRINTQEKLINAAMTLVNEAGFHNTPTSKIAKKAGYSEATIYKYFSNKDDLLIAIYVKIKKDLVGYVFNGNDEIGDIKAQSRIILNNYLDYFINHPDQLQYYLQFVNSVYMTRFALDRGIKQFEPLITMIENGIKNKQLKDMPVAFYHAFVHIPILEIARASAADELELTPELKKMVIDNIIESILIS